MSQPSIEQDPVTKRWYWYDEAWERSTNGYRTRKEASRAQTAYARRLVEKWDPFVGEYCWWNTPDGKRVPVRITHKVKKTLPYDWTVRALNGRYRPTPVSEIELEPMIDMEVLAAAYADHAAIA